MLPPLTKYEVMLKDAEFLTKLRKYPNCDAVSLRPWAHRFKWRYVVIDEAQRLKNSDSKLYSILNELKCSHRLLLTGTPIQNNLGELWALLHFVAPSFFSDRDAFERFFRGTSSAQRGPAALSSSKQHQLQNFLQPFLLRRLKAQVNLAIPQKREVVVYTVRFCTFLL
jgi:SNF2 family DNA or RNA helicase